MEWINPRFKSSLEVEETLGGVNNGSIKRAGEHKILGSLCSPSPAFLASQMGLQRECSRSGTSLQLGVYKHAGLYVDVCICMGFFVCVHCVRGQGCIYCRVCIVCEQLCVCLTMDVFICMGAFMYMCVFVCICTCTSHVPVYI